VDEAAGGLVAVEVCQVVCGQGGGDVAFQGGGVFGADLEVDLVAGVGGDCFADVAGHLGEVLVGQGQGEAVAAGFGEDVVQGVRQGEEVVGFVEHDRAVGACGLAGAGAGGGTLPGAGEDEAAE